jgi:hypothetical protein
VSVRPKCQTVLSRANTNHKVVSLDSRLRSSYLQHIHESKALERELKTFTLLLLIFLVGCDSSESPSDSFVPDTRIHPLPVSQADALCDEPLVEISGGDLMESADRIVVGTVTSVEAVQEFFAGSENCSSEHVNWSVRVRLDVDENLKGSGETVEFTLGTELQLEFWDSQPVYKRGGEWTPTWAGEPTFQVSSSFGP